LLFRKINNTKKHEKFLTKELNNEFVDSVLVCDRPQVKVKPPATVRLAMGSDSAL